MAEDKINRDISGSTSDEELIGYDYYPVDPSYGVPPSGFSWENPRLWLTPEQDKYYQGTIKDIEDDFRMSEESRREQVLDRMNRLLGDVKKRAYEDWIKAIDLYQLAETEEDKEFAIDLMREVIKNSQSGSGSVSDEELLEYRDAMPRQPGSGATSAEEFLAYRDAMSRANPTRFGASRSDPNIDLGKYGALGIMPRGSGVTII
tara:strand:+ start:627 stop:1238 length:612 start_codon:yes stop_codon:yes gene_type:complete